MTPQKIKLTRHDGSDVCPTPPDAAVLQINDMNFNGVASAKHILWKHVTAFAVIELVEPDPVIQVGDVVSINWSPSTSVYTVLAIHGGWVWYLAETGHCHTAKLSDLALVRKGGAV